METKVAILVHNVRSAHNVGSMFRTADAAGVSKVYLSGYTPVPIDGFGRIQKEIAKTALGAEQYLSWEYAKNPTSLIERARRDGFEIVGVEQDSRSRDYNSFRPKRRTLYLFGNEVRGLSPRLRNACDVIIEIPMHGKKESLNVAVTAGIILFNTRIR